MNPTRNTKFSSETIEPNEVASKNLSVVKKHNLINVPQVRVKRANKAREALKANLEANKRVSLAQRLPAVQLKEPVKRVSFPVSVVSLQVAKKRKCTMSQTLSFKETRQLD